ncbi:MAG: ribosome small subunit-dependent GTPase A [Chloroflexi bacterium]|nr:ribosome small subunit-dependent GTPase A [Chloroflexota bacterium]
MNDFAGMVVRTDGYQVTVRTDEGAEMRSVLRGRLREARDGETNGIVIGDRVELRSISPIEGVVQRVLPRHSQLARSQPRYRKQSGLQVLVANLDLALIVVPTPPRETVIDRYVDMAVAGGCHALVCINKIDLGDSEAASRVADKYVAGGTSVVLTSAVRGDGIEQLRASLTGKLAAFVGPSGAGKSSLMNALEPGLQLRVGDLSAAGKGAHTTTWSQIFSVAGGLVADTPGLREIEYHADIAFDIAPDLFSDIRELSRLCRFRDCSHTHEPRCAVKERVEAGEIDEGAYRRYLRLAKKGMV